jgi:hypothetical protein
MNKNGLVSDIQWPRSPVESLFNPAFTDPTIIAKSLTLLNLRNASYTMVIEDRWSVFIKGLNLLTFILIFVESQKAFVIYLAT